MPLYEYRCESCDQVIEVLQKFSDDPLSTCTSCGGGLERLISPPGLHFKGSGWYVTDYARAGKKGDSDSKPAKTESKPAAAKSDSKKSTTTTTKSD